MQIWIVWLLSLSSMLAGIRTDAMLDSIAQEANTTAPFSFAVMGDSRNGNAVLARIIAAVNRDPAIRFGFNNGDLVPHGSEKEFATYAKILARATHPILSIIGNHDVPRWGGKTRYRRWIGAPYFSFAYGNSYFIVVDNANMKGLDTRQWRWLVQTLRHAQAYRHRFVFMHVPLYDPRKGAYAKGHSLRSLSNARRINDLLDRYHITMLFASHIHAYYRGTWHATPYIITGGAGAPLKSGGFYHYIHVQVAGDTVTYRIVRVEE